MTKFAKYLLIFLATTSTLLSQANYPMSAGINAGFRAAINGVETPIGRQNAVAFASIPEAGISLYIPVAEETLLGAKFNIFYSSYSFGIKDFSDNTVYQHNMSYLKFNPELFFAGFLFGFSYAISLGGNLDGENIKSPHLVDLTEFSIAYEIPLFTDDTGRLNLCLRGGYMLGGIFDDFTKQDPLKTIVPEDKIFPVNNSHNPRAAWLLIGFSYMFNF